MDDRHIKIFFSPKLCYHNKRSVAVFSSPPEKKYQSDIEFIAAWEILNNSQRSSLRNLSHLLLIPQKGVILGENTRMFENLLRTKPKPSLILGAVMLPTQHHPDVWFRWQMVVSMLRSDDGENVTTWAEWPWGGRTPDEEGFQVSWVLPAALAAVPPVPEMSSRLLNGNGITSSWT